jgi:hypothetical protein
VVYPVCTFSICWEELAQHAQPAGVQVVCGPEGGQRLPRDAVCQGLTSKVLFFSTVLPLGNFFFFVEKKSYQGARTSLR